MMAVTKLIKGMDRAHLAILMGIAGNTSTGAVLSVLKDSGPEVIAALAALIGLAWYHEDQDLETVRSPDLLAYGEQVYEELHDEGYTLSEISALALVLVRAIWEHSQLSAEVQDRAGFFFPMLGMMRSPASTSGSTTSDPPSDSEN